MTTGDQLKKLLSAYRDKDDATFRKVALSIISDESSANHHALARDLKKALGEEKKSGDLVFLSREKRSGILNLVESHVSSEQIVLTDDTENRIKRVLEEHKSTQTLAKYGYQPKRKLLFWGPPGCGKTLSAHYLAYELGLPIGTVRLSSLISSFLGDTAAHLDAVFEAGNSTPMVLLLDEVDALGKSRDDLNDIGELKRVVNSLLQAMDRFTGKKSILIAASNHEHLLDPALWRRFDDVIEFPLPDRGNVLKDLKRLTNGVKVEGNLEEISELLNGFSFADIEKVVTESIKTMILEKRTQLNFADIIGQVKLYRRLPSSRIQ